MKEDDSTFHFENDEETGEKESRDVEDKSYFQTAGSAVVSSSL